MSFPQAIEAGFTNYVNFSSRASRSEYWIWIFRVVEDGDPAQSLGN